MSVILMMVYGKYVRVILVVYGKYVSDFDDGVWQVCHSDFGGGVWQVCQ